MREEPAATLVLLELSPPLANGEPLYLVVRSHVFQDTASWLQGWNDYPQEERDAYFFNEHTCTSNLFRPYYTPMVIYRDDPDPHGIFSHVQTVIEPTQEQYMALISSRRPEGPNRIIPRGRIEHTDLTAEELRQVFSLMKPAVRSVWASVDRGER